MTPLSIRLVILRILATAQPYAMPAETLQAEVNRLVRPALKVDEFKGHLSWLLDRSMADFLPDDLDPKNADARKWLIREAGLAALKK